MDKGEKRYGQADPEFKGWAPDALAVRTFKSSLAIT